MENFKFHLKLLVLSYKKIPVIFSCFLILIATTDIPTHLYENLTII